MNFLNHCIWRATAGGAGPFVVASAISGYLVPEDCLDPVVVDNGDYHALITSDDLSQWIIVDGTYTVIDDTFTITLTHDTSAGFTTFSAAPIVILGCPLANDVAFRGYENVTTANATPKAINTNVLITYVTTDGSGLEQTIEFPTLTVPEINVKHLIVLKTQTDPGDILRVTGIGDYDFLIAQADGFLSASYYDGLNTWVPSNGFGGFSGGFEGAANEFPLVLALGQFGGIQPLIPLEYTDFYNTAEDVIMVAAAGAASSLYYLTNITTDGSAGTQTITLSSPDISLKASIPHLFKLTTQTDPADEVVIAADIGIVGSEVITLPALDSWALLILTKDGWLPLTFGGGATTNAVGNRVLTLADTGGLSWV